MQFNSDSDSDSQISERNEADFKKNIKESEAQFTSNQLQIQQLEIDLMNGLQEKGMKDIEELKQEIEEKKIQITALEKKQSPLVKKRQKSLEGFEVLLSLYQQIEQLNQTQLNLPQKQTNENNLESILSNSQNKLDILTKETFDEQEIQETQQLLKDINNKNEIRLNQVKSDISSLNNLPETINDSDNKSKDSTMSDSLIEKQKRGFQIYLNQLTSNLNDIEQDISLMPECSEKYLLKIIINSVQLVSINDSNSQSKQQELLSLFKNLTEHLQIEDMRSNQFQCQLNLIEANLKNRDWQNLIYEVDYLLKQIRPFNIQEFLRLVKKSQDTAISIKEQDIILLLGGTGSGKSTTTHFLAGSKMVKLSAEIAPQKYLDYIGPDPQSISNKSLQNVKVGFKAESETRYPTPVAINLKDISKTQIGTIILVDSPGFGDTAGAEVDIANGIGIVEGLYGCKSVRPVILISQKSIGDRGEGIKKMANTLSGLVTNLEDNLSAFSYFFTKFSQNSQIHEELINIQESVQKNKDESLNNSFKALFDDMIEQTDCQLIKLDPINDKPCKIMKLLLKQEPIKNPNKVFKISLNENSKSILTLQVNYHKQSIMLAIKRQDYSIVLYKLDELKKLIDVTKQEFLNSVYEECKNQIIDGINKDYNDTKTQFNHNIINQITLCQEDLLNYKMCIERFQFVEKLRENYLEKNVPQTSSLIQNLLQQANSIYQSIDLQNLKNNQVNKNLNNLKLLADSFTELQDKYKQIYQTIEEHFKTIFESSKQIVQQNEFNKLPQILSLLQWSQIELNSHLDVDQMVKYQSDIKNSFKNHLTQICMKIYPIFHHQRLETNDINQLNQTISILEQAKEAVNYSSYLNISEIDILSSELVDKILSYFQSVTQKITDLLKSNSEDLFKQIEAEVKQMGMVRQIQGIQLITSEQYYKTIQEIVGQMDRLKQQAEQLLTTLQSKENNVDYDKVYLLLTGLRNAQWMEGIRPGTYNEIMKKITESIIKHSNKIRVKLSDLDFSLAYDVNIIKGQQIIQQIDDMSQLEEIIVDLSEILDDIKEQFKMQLITAFKQILEKFNEQPNYKNSAIQELQKYLSEYIKKKEYQFLKKYSYTSIDILNEEIRLNQQNYQQLVKKMDTDLQNCHSKFLKPADCSSIEEFQQKTLDNEEKLKELKSVESKMKEDYKIQSEKLNQIKNDYDQMLIKLNRDQSFNFNINFTKQQLEYNQNFTFCKLDGNLAEQAIKYLEACKNIKLVKKETKMTNAILNQYFISYHEFIQNEIQNFSQSFIDTQQLQINDLLKKSHRIASYFQNIQELKSNQQIFKLIKGNLLLENLIQFLDEQLIFQSDQTNLNLAENQENSNQLSIIKALSKFDFLFVSKKFYDLYLKVQSDILNDSNELSKNLYNLINKNDYQSIMKELQEIGKYYLNDQKLGRICHQLKISITDIVERTKVLVVQIEKDIEFKSIQEIFENLEKIQTAKLHIIDYYSSSNEEKPIFKTFFKKENSQQIEEEVQKIKEIFNAKIMKSLESIDGLVNAFNFEEAEKKRDKISSICKLININSVDEVVMKKINSLQSQYEKFIGESTIEKYENMEIKNYIVDSPKLILDSLKKVQHHNPYYEKAYRILRSKILDKMRKKIKEALNQSLEQRKNQYFEIEQALPYIEDDLKIEIESSLTKSKISDQEVIKLYEEEYKNKIHCRNMKETYEYYERCSSYGLETLAHKLLQEIAVKAMNIKDLIIENLQDDQKIQQVFQNIKMLKECMDIFGKPVQDIQKSFSAAQTKIETKFQQLHSYLMQLANYEETEKFNFKLKHLQDYIDFQNEQVQMKQECVIFNGDFYQKINEIYGKFYDYFAQNKEKYEKGLEQLNFQLVNESINILQKWNFIFKLIQKQQNSLHESNKSNKILQRIFEDCKPYQEVVENISDKLDTISQQILSFQFIEGYSDKRNKYYQILDSNLMAFKNALILSQHIPQINTKQLQSVQFVQNYLNKSLGSTVSLLKNATQLTKEQLEIISFNYDNFISLEKNVNLKQIKIDAKQKAQEIKQQIIEFVKNLQNNMQETKKDSKVADNLINMKLISNNISSLKEEIDQKIDQALNDYSKNNKNKKKTGQALSTYLEQEQSGIGHQIIQEHQHFKAQQISLFNLKTQRHGIDYILENITGDNLNKVELEECYQKFNKKYKKQIKKYIAKLEDDNFQKSDIIKELIISIQEKAKPIQMKQKKEKIVWDFVIRSQLPVLIAHIFTLMTINNYENFEMMQDSSSDYLFQPHAGQIISIFRLLGIGYDDTINGLSRNLIQIGTGEGKSVTLSVTVTVLALVGFDVSCACYSQYLSNRDYKSFLYLFDYLDITKYIKYATFNLICERMINLQGDIRQKVIKSINNEEGVENIREVKDRLKILLIDEADVFFGKEFYGSIYSPLASLKDPLIEELTDYIWENRNQSNLFKDLQQSQQYKNFLQRFEKWEDLMKESVKSMLSDLKDFKHEYIVKDDRIAYHEHDGISFNTNYGFKTLFSYYYEHEQGNISKKSLQENIFIGINCGYFSYIEIPSQFQCIMGVTGTLNTLNISEKKIVEDTYQIKLNTFIPSVFGSNKCDFRVVSDVYIENINDYFMKLAEQIELKLTNGKTQQRAVLVFFESKEKLMKFYESKETESLKKRVQIITEDISQTLNEKQQQIRRATASGQITFLTRAFGRGTDFICNDQIVISNQGVHAIQTFLSYQISEETQIKGRVARQGQDGSFSLILLDQELEGFIGLDYKSEILKMRQNSQLYQGLQIYRDQLLEKEYNSINKEIKIAQKQHAESLEFIKHLEENNQELLKQYLIINNKSSFNYEEESRICILMDATGSMDKLLKQVKATILTMFERSQEILKNNNIQENSFKIQLAVYRDYDQQSNVLQYSAWEANPINLRSFMSNIEAKGGDDYEEAIEIGLQHVNQENLVKKVTQVILIGDAPSKSQEQIQNDRKKYGGESFWQETKFKEITNYKKEITILQKESIPVHTFYLQDAIKDHFNEISQSTGGKCQKLNINSDQSSEILINLITEIILQIVGQSKGKGEQLVQAYREKYLKSYK